MTADLANRNAKPKLSDTALDQLFRKGRSFSNWLPGEVTNSTFQKLAGSYNDAATEDRSYPSCEVFGPIDQRGSSSAKS